MSVTTAIAAYFILWWLVLFAVLPWGVRSQQESGDVSRGTDPGAPTIPQLWRKLVWTTIVSALVFVILYFVYISRLVTIVDLATLGGLLN